MARVYGRAGLRQPNESPGPRQTGRRARGKVGGGPVPAAPGARSAPMLPSSMPRMSGRRRQSVGARIFSMPVCSSLRLTVKLVKLYIWGEGAGSRHHCGGLPCARPRQGRRAPCPALPRPLPSEARAAAPPGLRPACPGPAPSRWLPAHAAVSPASPGLTGDVAHVLGASPPRRPPSPAPWSISTGGQRGLPGPPSEGSSGRSPCIPEAPPTTSVSTRGPRTACPSTPYSREVTGVTCPAVAPPR